MDELGDVNMRAISDFERVSARQAEMKEQIETLAKERKEILERMSGYEKLKKEATSKTAWGSSSFLLLWTSPKISNVQPQSV